MATCTNGHANPESNRFCMTCGLVISPNTSTNNPSATGQVSTGPVAASANQGWGNTLETPPAQPSRPAWVIPVAAIGGAVVLAAAAVGISQIAGGPSTATLDLTLTVYNDDGCDLGLGYFDVPGSTVIVSVDGVPSAFGELPTFGDDGFISCEFTTLIPDVPTDGQIYEIEIGRRGDQTLTRTELESSNWSYEASLGL